MHVCWVNSAGSSLMVEKSSLVVASDCSTHTHSHTVEPRQILSDAGSDEGMEARGENGVEEK